jgi:molybdopterin-binding protein
MKISARNVIEGKVKSIARGAVYASVTVKVKGGTDVVSMVPLEAVERLGFDVGDEVYAVFDASDVMIGVPHGKRGE